MLVRRIPACGQVDTSPRTPSPRRSTAKSAIPSSVSAVSRAWVHRSVPSTRACPAQPPAVTVPGRGARGAGGSAAHTPHHSPRRGRSSPSSERIASASRVGLDEPAHDDVLGGEGAQQVPAVGGGPGPGQRGGGPQVRAHRAREDAALLLGRRRRGGWRGSQTPPPPALEQVTGGRRTRRGCARTGGPRLSTGARRCAHPQAGLDAAGHEGDVLVLGERGEAADQPVRRRPQTEVGAVDVVVPPVRPSAAGPVRAACQAAGRRPVGPTSR